MKENRLDYLDMVKGVGIIGVVLVHSMLLPYVGEGWLTSFLMAMFYMLSGFLLGVKNPAEEKFGNYVFKKFRGIMIPYFAFSIVSILVQVARHMLNPSNVSTSTLKMYGLQSVALCGISVLWFLPAMFLGEICMYGLLKGKHKYIVSIIVAVLAAAADPILKNCLDKMTQVSGNTATLILYFFLLEMLRVLPAIAFLVIGYFLHYIVTRVNFGKIYQVILGLAFIAADVYISVINGRTDMQFLIFNNVALYYLGATICTLGAILVLKNMPKLKLLSFLGKNSLVIMLTHLDLYSLALSLKMYNLGITKIPGVLGVICAWILGMIMFVGVESIYIYIFNRYLFFMLGKTKPAMKSIFVKK